MVTKRVTGRALLAAGLMFVVGAAGCQRKPVRPADSRAVEAPPPIIQAPPPVPVPVPTESELAAAAGGRAESYGMFEQAALEYERAARTAGDADARSEAHWSLARLWADPANPGRDIERARLACLAVLESGLSTPRQREARVLLTLLRELSESRAAAAELKAGLDAARGAEAAMKEELTKKDQELERIKKVLLEKKP